MILHTCAQDTPEWLQLRLGLPTASEFLKIVTPGGKRSDQQDGYMFRLLAEKITGAPLEDVETKWMRRGQEEQDSAIRAYELRSEIETDAVGFITNDAVTYGCSPDRLVGERGLAEFKAPLAQTQIAYLLTKAVDEKYKPQLQGQLHVSERDWVDIFAWHPTIASVLIHVVRDEKYIALLATELDRFVDIFNERYLHLESHYGPFAKKAAPEKQEGIGYLGITDEDLREILADHGMTL